MVGRVLIATGVLMFGFVGYQLWGTGIEYAQAQDELDAELDAMLAATTTAPAGSQTATPAPVAAPPALTPGAPVGEIEIPDIGLNATVIEGVGRDDLKQAPGHYPFTPMPGQLGNAAIAGHRSTYGAPFAQLDELDIGDRIIVTTAQGRFVYRMTAVDIVNPSRSDVVATTDPNVARLTLTTCHPEFSAQYRMIVFAELDVASSAVPAPYQPPAAPAATPADLAGEGPADPASPAGPAGQGDPTATTVVPPGPDEVTGDPAAEEAFAQGWFSDERAFDQVALWGMLLGLIGVVAAALSRAVRRNWVGALAGIAPFVVVAYFFFQNVNRLLPAAL